LPVGSNLAEISSDFADVNIKSCLMSPGRTVFSSDGELSGSGDAGQRHHVILRSGAPGAPIVPPVQVSRVSKRRRAIFRSWRHAV